ncbi:MAG TPA: hypothetical protein VKX16_10345 [Chloroflexota bacterium]|nr:hypothetical protein [Chloroflexota bacterium]
MDKKRQQQIIQEVLDAAEEQLFRARLALELDTTLAADTTPAQAEVDRYQTIVSTLQKKLKARS